MGDRGNIAIVDSDGSTVYLYSHWTGSELGEVLQGALSKGWRWDDAPYLARIIFEEMISGQEGTETGFGISTKEIDRNHSTWFVDTSLQQVRQGSKKWTFNEFIVLPVAAMVPS